MSSYNTKIIDYGDYLHIEFFDKCIKRSEDEDTKNIKEEIENEIIDYQNIDDEKKKEHCLKTSVNRSKNNLYHIARSNKWDLFITITFNRNKTDSSDYVACSKKITNFLNNLRKRNPELKYLVVPELHKDGIHYHYHGLLANVDCIELEDSGKVDFTGEKIYNIKNWRDRKGESLGFTTATYIKNQSAVRNYIGKYITKELMQKLKYKKRYYASKNVNLCYESFHLFQLYDLYDMFGDNISYAKTVTINGINRIKYFEVKKDIDN